MELNDDVFWEIIGHLPINNIKNINELNKHYNNYCKNFLVRYPVGAYLYPLDKTIYEWKNNYNELKKSSFHALNLTEIIEKEQTKVYLVIDDKNNTKFNLFKTYNPNVMYKILKLTQYNKGFKFKLVLQCETYTLIYLFGNIDKVEINICNLYDLVYRYCYFYGNDYHAVDENNIPFDMERILKKYDSYDNWEKKLATKRLNHYLS